MKRAISPEKGTSGLLGQHFIIWHGVASRVETRPCIAVDDSYVRSTTNQNLSSECCLDHKRQ